MFRANALLEPNMPGSRPDLESIFFAAQQKAPEERAAYLDEVCGDDAELRHRVERFLGAQAELGSFLKSPAAELRAQLEEEGAAVPAVPTVDEPVRERPGMVIDEYKL